MCWEATSTVDFGGVQFGMFELRVEEHVGCWKVVGVVFFWAAGNMPSESEGPLIGLTRVVCVQHAWAHGAHVRQRCLPELACKTRGFILLVVSREYIVWGLLYRDYIPLFPRNPSTHKS